MTDLKSISEKDFQYPSFTTKEQSEEFKKNLINYLGFELPIRVVGDDILVLVQLSSKRLNSDGTESMIALPDSVVEVEAFKLKKGVVLDVGPEAYSNEGRVGVQYKAPWCKVGDIILFSTTPIYYRCNNKALAIMRAAEVRAVIKDIDCVDYYFKNI